MSSLPKSLRTAVERLRAPLAMRLYMSKRDREDVIGRFHILYYDLAPRTWKNTRWLGVPVRKLPLDLWLYQELVHDLRPELIVETGTLQGGSAVFLGTICELIDHGRVVSIDIAPERQPAHPRVTYLEGSSTSEKVLAQVRQMAQDAKSVLVILDSDHSRAHVLEELRAFGPLVTPGSYVVVEDTNVNGHPVHPSFGPGPTEAIEDFLAESRDFERDTTMEKFLLTFNPGGYLKRVG